jgi:hypothetical protein
MSFSLPDARHLADETLQALPLRALLGIQLGYSEVELAQLIAPRKSDPPLIINTAMASTLPWLCQTFVIVMFLRMEHTQ